MDEPTIYEDAVLREEFEKRHRESGKRMDVRNSCVRFTKLENLPLDVIAWAVSQTGVEARIERYEKSRA